MAVAAEMADDTSLWREVQRLIALRHSTPALGVNAAVDFVYCEKDAYPLVYLRSVREEGGQRVLVALNPAAREVEVPCDFEVARVLYALARFLAEGMRAGGIAVDGRQIRHHLLKHPGGKRGGSRIIKINFSHSRLEPSFRFHCCKAGGCFSTARSVCIL